MICSESTTERVGFEPTVPEGTTVFETVRFNHSRTYGDPYKFEVL